LSADIGRTRRISGGSAVRFIRWFCERRIGRTKEAAMRHAFKILEELGAECDRLGVRVVDVHGERGSASEFLAKIVRYIEARENECDALRATPKTGE
jgi:hypothetical protein